MLEPVLRRPLRSLASQVLRSGEGLSCGVSIGSAADSVEDGRTSDCGGAGGVGVGGGAPKPSFSRHVRSAGGADSMTGGTTAVADASGSASSTAGACAASGAAACVGSTGVFFLKNLNMQCALRSR